jgi:hypothetical protein
MGIVTSVALCSETELICFANFTELNSRNLHRAAVDD